MTGLDTPTKSPSNNAHHTILIPCYADVALARLRTWVRMWAWMQMWMRSYVMLCYDTIWYAMISHNRLLHNMNCYDMVRHAMMWCGIVHYAMKWSDLYGASLADNHSEHCFFTFTLPLPTTCSHILHLTLISSPWPIGRRFLTGGFCLEGLALSREVPFGSLVWSNCLGVCSLVHCSVTTPACS